MVILIVILAHSWFVLYLGPKFMENKRPFDLQLSTCSIQHNAGYIYSVIYCDVYIGKLKRNGIPYHIFRCEPSFVMVSSCKNHWLVKHGNKEKR